MRAIIKTFLILTVLLTVSCENPVMYRSYQHIPRNGWNKNDTLELDVAITDSLTNRYQLHLLVRNRAEYDYQNLALAVDYNFPDSMHWRTDTIFFHIADSNSNWLGKGISGLYENTVLFHTAQLNRPGNYTFRITSLMGDSILTGINDIGIIAWQE